MFHHRFVCPLPSRTLAKADERAEVAVQLRQGAAAVSPLSFVFTTVRTARQEGEQHKPPARVPYDIADWSGDGPVPAIEGAEDIKFVPDGKAGLAPAVHPQNEDVVALLDPRMKVSPRADGGHALRRDVPRLEDLPEQVWSDRVFHRYAARPSGNLTTSMLLPRLTNHLPR